MLENKRALADQLGRAVGCHQRGDLEGAARLYQAVLAQSPAEVDALHYLGLLEAQRGNAAAGAQLLRRAAGLNPRIEAVHLNLANMLLELGALDEALASVDQALAINAGSALALNSRGLILLEAGRAPEALAAFERALSVAPDYAEALNNRGNALLQLGRAEEALASYERALALNPQSEQVLNNRGNALLELKRHDEAVASFDRALELRPDYAEALHHRGTAKSERREEQAALADIERALQIHPRYPEALNSRGNVLVKLGRLDEALASYDAALAMWPEFVDALGNRGYALLRLGREDEALASCDQALHLDPYNASALNTSGNVLMKRRGTLAALAQYERALNIQPNYVDALSNRGNALLELNRIEEALASYDSALSVDAIHENALHGRGLALHLLKRDSDAIAMFAKIAEINPDYPYALGYLLHLKLGCCDWSGYAAATKRVIDSVRAGKRASNPFIFLSLSNSAADQLHCARIYIENEHLPVSSTPLGLKKYQHERIRLAYVSADFLDHPVALLIASLIEQHDRNRFEVIGISLSGESQSKQGQRLKRAFDRFIDVSSMPDPDVASYLRGLEIDIAIDLMGHTAHARMGIWARRIAPIQVNYLGFAGTSGAEYLDYIVADAHVIPEGSRQNYSEKVIYLPDTFMPQEAAGLTADSMPTRAGQGLPENGFVFCCFNNHPKLSPPVFDIWMRLLQQIDGSVLWLSKGTAESQRNLLAEALKRGVAAQRLIFADRMEKLEDHLARQRLADLFLDTFPYNAHATASNALRMGLPVVTCMGETYASRVAGSLLFAVGMPELVTSSPADYEALANRLAENRALLSEYRSRLARNRVVFPLFEGDRYRRHIEAAYVMMWEKTQAGEEPASFTVPPRDA